MNISREGFGIHEALEDYEKARSGFRHGVDSYSSFELQKLYFADAVLEAIGYACVPTPPDFEKRAGPQRGDLKRGFVYLALNRRNGFHKIGWSIQPEIRERTLQSEEPEVEFVGTWPATMLDEAALHLRFTTCRLRGEWFRLESAHVLEIQEYFARRTINGTEKSV